MIFIGIDTGVHTGIAVWDTKRKVFCEIATLKIHQAMQRVMDWDLMAQAADTSIHVFIEDARQRKYFQREKSVSEYRGKMMGAGSVKRDATIWEDFLKDYGYVFTMVAPQKGLTKWSEDTFKRYTGWTGRTSNHARDAALLVFSILAR